MPLFSDDIIIDCIIDHNTKRIYPNKKLGKLDSSKFKTFMLQIRPSKKKKKKTQNGRKSLETINLMKDLYPEYMSSLRTQKWKQITHLKNRQKIEYIFSKENIQIASKYIKRWLHN